MPRWNARKPLLIPNPVKGGGAPRFLEIKFGESISAKIATPEFIGGRLDCLSGLTRTDHRKLAIWKEKNPRVAHRWDYLLNSPLRMAQLTSITEPANQGENGGEGGDGGEGENGGEGGDGGEGAKD